MAEFSTVDGSCFLWALKGLPWYLGQQGITVIVMQTIEPWDMASMVS